MSSSTITGTLYGQLILVDCTHTIVDSLTVDHTYIGLYLLYCDDITVIDNDFSNNYYGIYLTWTSHCDITENEISYNTINGVYSYRSTSNIYTYNDFRENYEYAMYLENYGDNNIIHHNNFYDNNQAQIFSHVLSQAFDGEDTDQNTWFDFVNQEGNYWSDLYDPNYYLIDSIDEARTDLYPLDTPAVPPIVSEFNGKNLSFVMVIPVILIIQLISKKRKSVKLKR